jgi:hypothetical protein
MGAGPFFIALQVNYLNFKGLTHIASQDDAASVLDYSLLKSWRGSRLRVVFVVGLTMCTFGNKAIVMFCSDSWYLKHSFTCCKNSCIFE